MRLRSSDPILLVDWVAGQQDVSAQLAHAHGLALTLLASLIVPIS